MNVKKYNVNIPTIYEIKSIIHIIGISGGGFEIVSARLAGAGSAFGFTTPFPGTFAGHFLWLSHSASVTLPGPSAIRDFRAPSKRPVNGLVDSNAQSHHDLSRHNFETTTKMPDKMRQPPPTNAAASPAVEVVAT